MLYLVFSSLSFLFWFLPIFLGIYFFTPKSVKNFILFVFSLIFYAWGEPVYICLMLFSTIFDYINGLLIEKLGLKTKGSKIVLIISMVGNLGLLGVFKYFDFFMGSLNNLFDLSFPFLNVALPIGISFYTFQTMSYTIDVYRGIVPAQHNIITFGSYVTMFPQLIAGPIVQYKTVEQELNNRSVNIEDIYVGVRRFAIGFVKKVFLANNIGFLWSEILGSYSHLSSITLILGLICFTFQIYFDFSGYSDMAIGLGRMLGFKFLENFNYPYISKSITEFWNCWHISLSSWFKEYVYIPLGGNRKGLKRQIINISIVWLLTGFWHGASWNYVLWGIYYGILLIIEKCFLLKKLKNKSSWLCHLYTLFFVVIGWGIFAIEDFNLLISYFENILINPNGFISSDIFYYIKNYILLIVICIISSLDLGKRVFEIIKESKYSKICIIVIDLLLVVCFVLSLAMLVSSTYNPFLYFRF